MGQRLIHVHFTDWWGNGKRKVKGLRVIHVHLIDCLGDGEREVKRERVFLVPPGNRKRICGNAVQEGCNFLCMGDAVKARQYQKVLHGTIKFLIDEAPLVGGNITS